MFKWLKRYVQRVMASYVVEERQEVVKSWELECMNIGVQMERQQQDRERYQAEAAQKLQKLHMEQAAQEAQQREEEKEQRKQQYKEWSANMKAVDMLQERLQAEKQRKQFRVVA